MEEVFLRLFYDILFWGALTWYADAVVPDKHGMSRSYCFFCDPNYWIPPTNAQEQGPGLPPEQLVVPPHAPPEGHEPDPEVLAEQEAITATPPDTHSVVIAGLQKVFPAYS